MDGKRIRMTIEGDQMVLYNLTDEKHVIDINVMTRCATVYSVNEIIETVRFGTDVKTLKL